MPRTVGGFSTRKCVWRGERSEPSTEMPAFLAPYPCAPCTLHRSTSFSARAPLASPQKPGPAPLRSVVGVVMCAEGPPADDEWQAAFDSGKELRDTLQRVSDERRLQSERTEKRLNEMSSQLSNIMTQIREQAGMPPVSTTPNQKETIEATEKPGEVQSKVAAAAAEAKSSTSSDDEPYMDPSNFGYDSAAGWQVLASENQLPVLDESGVKFRIECDQDGCSIIELQGDSPAGSGVRSQFLTSGPGFRVGFDPDGPPSFCGTIGGEQWLLAMSRDEIRHFKRLTLALQKKMDRIARGLDDPPVQKHALRRSGDGMFNERVRRSGTDCSVELESKLLWVQALGAPEMGGYCIRVILMEGRQAEGYWEPKHVPGFIAAVAQLQIE